MTKVELTPTFIITTYLSYIPVAGLPSGELYARVMEHGIDLGAHQVILDALSGDEVCKNGPLVIVKNHFVLLTERGLELRRAVLALLANQMQRRKEGGAA